MNFDIIDFWQKQIDKWNDEGGCGFDCWTYGAPLIESGIEKTEQEEDSGCCVHVFITNLRKSTRTSYSSQGYLNGRDVVVDFDIHFLVRDDIGKNVYNEIPEYPITDSKWANILKPLEQCLMEERILEFCELIGVNPRINQWQMNAKINWLENYTGWTIYGTFVLGDL